MTTDRSAGLDLPALAEDIAADRRTLSNVIDQIAVAEPDDEARRRAVSELQSLVMTLTAVRRHARDTRTSADSVGSENVVSEPLGLRRRGRAVRDPRSGRSRLILGTGTVLLAIAILAAIATWLR